MFSNSQTDQKTHTSGGLSGLGASQFDRRTLREPSLAGRVQRLADTTPSQTRHFSVLIVEDDRDFCYELFDYFETQGFDVTGTHDERTAGHLLTKGNYDVVILNLDMPYRMGLTLLQDARQHHQDLRSILLTERRIDSQLVTKARAAGCVKLFSKPIDYETVHHVIMRCREEHLSLTPITPTNAPRSNHDGNHSDDLRHNNGTPATTLGIPDGRKSG